MPREKSSTSTLPSGVITAMFTDIVESTRIKSLMEGETSGRRDAHYRQLIKEPHDAIVLAYVSRAGGYIVNPTGDGFCITFVDVEEAVLCALRIQQHLTAHPITTPLGDLQIRIGLHTGMVGPSSDDYIASTIDKTARVQSQAGGGQVFVSHQTQVLVSDKTHGVQFVPRGIFDLKGLQAQELYEVVPLADLELSPLPADSIASTAIDPSHISHLPRVAAPEVIRPMGFRGKPVIALLSIALIGLMSFGLWKHFQRDTARSSRQNSPQIVARQILPKGSYWEGNFHFLPPMASYNGSVALRVTQRSEKTFSGIYSTENAAYQWLVEGTVRGKNIRWDFVKAIKNPGTEDAVGKAYGVAVVEGDQMKGFFRVAAQGGESARLDLRATK